MTDRANSATGGEVAGPWLSPCEALTRYVPGPQTLRQEALEIAPIRFGCRIGSIGLLVPAGMLSELVDDAEIYPLPTTPAWFRGLINLRGGLVPVFDLKELFTNEEPDGDKANLLVLNPGPGAVALLIDGLPLTLDISSRLPQSPPLPEVLREHSQGVYFWEQDIWVDFDFDGFFQAVGNRIVV